MDPMDLVLDIVVGVLLLVGCLMSLTAGLGLIRLPDVLSRMHAATKPQVLGLLCMLLAADPLANFIDKNPTVVMLALGFLLMIGMTLIADGFGFHVPKGYIYAAMGFSALVEGLNMLARRGKQRGGDH